LLFTGLFYLLNKVGAYLQAQDAKDEHEEIDNLIEAWHLGKAGKEQELHEFLGMTWDDYTRWLAKANIYKK